MGKKERQIVRSLMGALPSCDGPPKKGDAALGLIPPTGGNAGA